MFLLLVTSIIWGFAFGLTKSNFAGIDSATLSTLRLLIAIPCFIFFFRISNVKSLNKAVALGGIGAIQFGVTYLALFASFQFLKAYEVALLTIFTPFFVVIFDAILKKSIPAPKFWIATILAILGAAVIFELRTIPTKIDGIIWMQISNMSFAFGQVAWRKMKEQDPELREHKTYALVLAGAAICTGLFAINKDPVGTLMNFDATQLAVLIYLSLFSTGLAFYMWNLGATKVNTATLAVFNNLKIPLASLISILVFKESADWSRLIPGLLIILAGLAIAEAKKKKA